MSNFKFKDPRAQSLSDSWKKCKSTVSSVQKDALGRAYLKYILQTSDLVIEKFLEGDFKAEQEIGNKQAGVERSNADLAAFWNETANIIPGLHTRKDLAFLIKEGELEGVLHFLFQLAPSPIIKDSKVLDAIFTNAHIYK